MARRLIQVGLGDFGRRWLRVVNANPDWEYAAVVTRNAAVRADCAREVGLTESREFSTLEDALAAGVAADAVLVTTPHFRHVHDVKLALEHGFHVLVEKPLAGTWSDCLAIRDAVSHAESHLMVGENYRFGEGSRIMRDLVVGGEIGELEYVSIDYFVGHEFPEEDWRNDYRYPMLIENATHQFDLVRYITGSDADSVHCNALPSVRTPHWAFPTVSAQFTMRRGFHLRFSGSWAYSELQTPWEGGWRVYGSTGAIRWAQDVIEVHHGDTARTIPVPSKPSDHTITATFAEFDRALSGGHVPQPDIDDNIQTLFMVYGAMRSHETHATVLIADMIGESATRSGI